MKSDCSTRIPWETLVAYWAGEVTAPELDPLEEHLFACAACTEASARVGSIAAAVRGLIPPVLDHRMVADLRARGLRIVENPVVRGERKECLFPAGVDILLHRLGGLSLGDARTVSVKVMAESTRDVLAEFREAPFDPSSGEVLIACQRHFAALPHDVLFEVTARHPSGAEERVLYPVPHRFA